jgi:foldase protein PrsA
VPPKLLTLLACLVVLTGAVATACSDGSGDGTNVSPSPSGGSAAVARVDGTAVTQEDVEVVRAEARLEGRTIAAAAGRDEAIRRELVSQAAARMGVSVSDAVIAARLSALEQKVGGADALQAGLSRARMTTAQLRASIAFRLLEEKLAAARFPGLAATRAAARDFYERHRADLFTTAAKVRLGDIVLPGELLARKLERRLQHGAAFAATARRYSMDEETKQNGGMLGWIAVASLPSELRAAIAGVAPGGVSDPVLSSSRWHLLKVLDRRAPTLMPFATVRSAVTDELTRRRRAKAMKDWLAREMKRADVEIVR